jgi:hypothetical protein
VIVINKKQTNTIKSKWYDEKSHQGLCGKKQEAAEKPDWSACPT